MTSPRQAALLTIPTVGGLLYLNMVFFLSPFFVIAVAATVFAGYSQAWRLNHLWKGQEKVSTGPAA